MYNFLCQNVLIFPIYIIHKITETFWSRDIINLRDMSTKNYSNSSCTSLSTKLF